MKLDPKINGVHDILTPFDTKEATGHIGEYCAFADHIEDFSDLKSGKVFYGELKKIREDGNVFYYPYEFELTVSHRIATAKFCFPYGRLLIPEKKWRPFSLTEWRHEYGIGSIIEFRLKNSHTDRIVMCCGCLSDDDNDLPGKGVINLGGELFVLQNLFDQFDLHKDDEWQPFGVEDIDNDR